MIDLSKLGCELHDDHMHDEPPQLPVTILDMQRTDGVYDMELAMADPCPQCGAFNMRVGDWVCWGTCYHCEIENSEL